ncbi:G2/mitotic specific cyclin 2 [Encephalitozoon intestinalis ATCC 50506]|uniref:G2/mitotic specific cyclin 2 n=1 Tax=Encephalitozoon intestinalis (strain ATCC 50506) TaxID=876142 RepID=E0S8G0_ENCIT|nr:G2/mitotic specific cyclin 2 [Encephalitozoon intestinalis ATCC 50506]ADM11954.1 G2/mitotic specific cyclin 2 [Encephalitozoon intestinalis ATCC 50506]UTX45737.1 G2/mitotic specific cyclin 2 [Encephalitozoon intestinalis]
MVALFRKSEPLRNVTNKIVKRAEKTQFPLSKVEEVVYRQQKIMDASQIVMADKYSDDIFEYFSAIDKPFVYVNDGVSWKMRSLLVDWIIDIHDKLGLCHDTLFLAINLVDRFLSMRSIPSSKLQLVGISALMIACKYEEVVCPALQTFVLLTEKTLTGDDVRKAEKYMLHTLNYDLQYVSPLNFLRKCSKANNYEINSRAVGKYLLELMTLYEEFLKFKGSVRAAAAMYLSRKMTSQDQCKNLFTMYSGHTKDDIKECFNALVRVISESIPFENIQNKYNTPKFLHVSSFVREYAEKNFK